MSYTLTAELKPEYLHVSVQGPNTPENVRNYLSEVRERCLKLNCLNVLIEENLQGPPLSTLAIFEIVSEASKSVQPALIRLAYVDINSEHDPRKMAFAEDVAVNRGINVKIFDSVAEAEMWLRSKR